MLPDVFTCIAAIGETGCGFEHQFASILRALGADGRAAPSENQGFLRPDAYLAIIMITNEDDCSATPGVPLFDTGSNTNIASQLGPPANFRCNEFGHICDGVHPSRNAPNNDMAAMVSYTSCASNDAEGYLLSVADTANRIKALKSDPEPDHRRVDPGPGDALHRELEGAQHGRHLVRRGVLPVAGDRALVHGERRQLRGSGGSHVRVRRPVRRQRRRAADLRRTASRRRSSASRR